LKTSSEKKIKEFVKNRYSKLAKRGCSCNTSLSACCPDAKNNYARVIGYSDEELNDLPDTVLNTLAGCGNPTALADLKEGETVLDLGSGGGIDAFLAAKKVGASGKVIGVDMTEEMIALANENKEKMHAKNVEFRLGEIEDLPVEDNSVDVIISNCVINLSPDKDKVFRGAFKALKPGGRMLISDIVTQGVLPDEIRENLELWAGCVAGALKEEEYLKKIRNAGFDGVQILSKQDFKGLVDSVKVRAYKPSN
jgi:ubiquinone/menaquinone biosynthesis C-methylase UbiE